MSITAQFLRNIMTEARPIIERQMDDAKLIAGFRTVVANNGGDWGALKALIKAHIEDENDETGAGKRVQKILEKADSSTAYADMLGLAKMNENNFSDEEFPPHDPSTGELTDTQEQPETATRRLDDLGSVQDGLKMSTDGQPKTGLSTDCIERPIEAGVTAGETASNTETPAVPSQADRDAGSDEHLPVATGSNSSEVA